MPSAAHRRPCPPCLILAIVVVAAGFFALFSGLGHMFQGSATRRKGSLSASKTPHTASELSVSSRTPCQEVPGGRSAFAEESRSSLKAPVPLVHFKNAINLALPNVSAIVRTYEGDGPRILPLLLSLLVAAEGQVNLNLIVANVERAGRERLRDAVAHANGLCERPAVHLELDWVYEGNRVPEKNAMFGYDATDAMLSRILKETRDQRDAGGWLLVTNGDNLYSSFFFEAVKQHMDGPADLIAT
ncbi:unnamed protein product, partial [Symbiodinium sp. KB8]